MTINIYFFFFDLLNIKIIRDSLGKEEEENEKRKIEGTVTGPDQRKSGREGRKLWKFKVFLLLIRKDYISAYYGLGSFWSLPVFRLSLAYSIGRGSLGLAHTQCLWL